ncbi:N-acetyl-alpha-D-glucosaminyl L-malate synthase BshA [bacterium]|nr:N-acetyl-alpha-D-glucosaminyl L-malate synthase BshA [candidate division CSSED10-310 bacterium]
MRIAINCHPTQGGSGIVATELAMGLADRGHRVHLIACERPFRLPETSLVHFDRVYIPDYPLFRYPPHDFSLINKIVDVVRAQDIDIIHAHYVVPHAICGIFARTMLEERRTKLVTTLHGTDITLVGSHPEFRTICQYAMNRSDALTAVSDWLSQRTFEEFTIRQEIVTIPNFVDHARFNSVGRSGFPGGSGEFILMHASNFRPVKRVMDIIRIFYHVQKKVPARLKLVGNGPELGLIREMCAELGICSKVDMMGSLAAIEDEMKSAHVFLLMSQYESFGLSALEAMACGTPVAASRSGGLSEVIEDGVSGLLEPVGDIGRMVRRIVSLLGDEQKWTEMSMRAEERSRMFDIGSVIDRYETLYQTVLAT